MHDSNYVTNQSMHGSQYVTNTPTWEGCWLQSFSIHPHDEDQEALWLQNPIAYKRNNFFKRKMNRANCLWSQYACNKKCSHLMMALKIIFIYIWGCKKRKPKHTAWICVKNRSENLIFVTLDRYSRRAICWVSDFKSRYTSVKISVEL